MDGHATFVRFPSRHHARDGIAKLVDLTHALNVNLNQLLHLDTIEPVF